MRRLILKSRFSVYLISVIAALIIPYQQPVYAHAYSAGYTQLELTKSNIMMTYTLDERSVIELTQEDMTHEGVLDEEHWDEIKGRLVKVLQANLSLKINGETQEMISLDQITLDRAGDEARVILNVKYPPAIASQSISLIDQLYMHDSSTNYVNLLTIHYGVNTSTAALSGDNRMWAMQLTEEDFASLPEHLDTEQTDNSAATHTGTNSSWQSFLWLGVNHILSGYDHILFLLTLLIARQSLKQYAGLITSFTIAHSITLSLTVLGWIDLSSKIVEPAIALSICYVALDNIFRKQISRRWIITFIFGLIHGMGFADILKEMDIPKSELAVNLISFNVGIEIVQLGIVVILLPILHYLYRWKFAKKAVMGGSSVAFILGAIWLVERILY